MVCQFSFVVRGDVVSWIVWLVGRVGLGVGGVKGNIFPGRMVLFELVIFLNYNSHYKVCIIVSIICPVS